MMPPPRSRTLPALFTVAVLAALLPWFVQPSTYWRDGAEFILSAAFLDISHPPGAPTYGQLINPLTWLPIGPLAARVTLASALIVTALGLQLASLAIAAGCRPLIAALIPVLLPFLPGVMHQALTAEVYALSAVCIVAMLQLTQKFEVSRDRRYLLGVAFVAGLGSGVHLIVAITGLAIALSTFCVTRGTLLRLSPSIVLAGLLGLAVWAYLPARASQAPPLNTGAPTNSERFIDHVTNARDRELRPQGGLESFHLSTHQVASDVRRFADFSGWPFVALAVLGAFVLCARQTLLGCALGATIATVAGLFAGWDFAPFTIISSAAALAAAFGIHSIAQVISQRRWPVAKQLATLSVSALFALCALTNAQVSPILAAELSTYELPAQATLDTLTAAAPHGTVLVERSHFLTSYLQAVEGVRPDVSVHYQPALEWPRYFRPERDTKGVEYTSLRHYLGTLPHNKRVTFEPSPFVTEKLTQVARCDDSAQWYLQRPLTGVVSRGCLDALIATLPSSQARSAEITNDEQHARELITFGSAEMLYQLGDRHEAKLIVETLCREYNCSAKGQLAAQSLLVTNP